MNPDEYVQVIILNETQLKDPAYGYFESEILGYAMDSCMRAWEFRSKDKESWLKWINGKFTKSTRRVNENTFYKICDRLVDGDYEYDYYRLGDRVIVFEPMTYGSMPKLLKSAQVQGVNFDSHGAVQTLQNFKPWYHNEIFVLINEDLQMSSGKKIAQACHGIMLWHLINNVKFKGIPVPIYCTQEEFDSIHSNVVICDAGLTEVEPGTATVKVLTAREVKDQNAIS